MIETECFTELNVMYLSNGELVDDLRPLSSINGDRSTNNHSASSSSKSSGFLTRLFKKRVHSPPNLNVFNMKCERRGPGRPHWLEALGWL